MIYRSERTEQGRTRSQSKFENNRPNNERYPLIQKYPFDIPGVSIAYLRNSAPGHRQMHHQSGINLT